MIHIVAPQVPHIQSEPFYAVYHDFPPLLEHLPALHWPVLPHQRMGSRVAERTANIAQSERFRLLHCMQLVPAETAMFEITYCSYI